MLNRRKLLAATGLAGLGWAVGTGPARAETAGPAATAGRAWTGTPIGLANTYLDAVASTRHGTWAVGIRLLDGFQETRPLALRRQGGRWVATPQPIRTNARLLSVAIGPAGQVWAVGSSTADQVDRPLVLRWDGRAWRVIKPPAVPTGTFGDVAVGPDGTVWVAGWASVDGAERGVVYTYAHGSWRLLGDGLEQTINGNTLLVRSATEAWLGANPGLARFDGKRWTPVEEFPGDGSQILTGLAADGPTDIWAAGVAHTPDRERPLVVHYDGSRWRTIETPAEYAQLYAVALWNGQPVAVGERFFESGDLVINKPYVLARRGGRFVAVEAPAVPKAATGVLTGLAADRSRLWTVGAVDQAALAAYHKGKLG